MLTVFYGDYQRANFFLLKPFRVWDECNIESGWKKRASYDESAGHLIVSVASLAQKTFVFETESQYNEFRCDINQNKLLMPMLRNQKENPSAWKLRAERTLIEAVRHETNLNRELRVKYDELVYSHSRLYSMNKMWLNTIKRWGGHWRTFHSDMRQMDQREESKLVVDDIENKKKQLVIEQQHELKANVNEAEVKLNGVDVLKPNYIQIDLQPEGVVGPSPKIVVDRLDGAIIEEKEEKHHNLLPNQMNLGESEPKEVKEVFLRSYQPQCGPIQKEGNKLNAKNGKSKAAKSKAAKKAKRGKKSK